MKCEDARLLLDLYLDGELALELMNMLDRHLLRCSDCAGDLRSLEMTRSLLREAVPAAEPSPGFRERCAARLQDRLSAQLRPSAKPENGLQWSLPFLKSDA